MVAFTSVVLLIILAVAAYLIARLRRRAQAKKLQTIHPECQLAPQYPHSEPFLGLDLVWKTGKLVGKNQAIEALQQHHAKHGTTYVANSFGQNVYYTTDAKNFEAVYSTKWTDWGVQPARLDALEPFCGRGFITMDGEAWRHARTSFSAVFNTKTSGISLEFTRTLKATLDSLPVHGEMVDMQPIMAQFFHDISGEFLVGKRFDNSMQSTFSRAYTESIAWLQIRVFFGIVGRNIPSLNFKRNCREIHAVIDRYLDDAIMKMAIGKHLSNKETHEPPANVVECLAASTTDRSALRSQIIQCIMAMQETTSTLVTNTLFLLSRHPALWSSLKDEVQSVELHEDSVSKLKEMKLLQNIMRESLRLFPIFATDGRTSLRDTMIPRGGGPDGSHPVFIPKDSRIITVFYGLHRDSKVFGPNIEDFDPSRWDRIKPGAWEYLPFSNGPRCCAGREMALNQAASVLATVAQRYARIESRDDRPWAGRWSLTWTNGNGCKIALHE